MAGGGDGGRRLVVGVVDAVVAAVDVAGRAEPMRQYPEGVPIRVRVQGDGQPVAFVWAGETHRIDSIEAVREPRLDWWVAGGEVHRMYYLVVTHKGVVCEIYRDVGADEWFVGRRLD